MNTNTPVLDLTLPEVSTAQETHLYSHLYEIYLALGHEEKIQLRYMTMSPVLAKILLTRMRLVEHNLVNIEADKPLEDKLLAQQFRFIRMERCFLEDIFNFMNLVEKDLVQYKQSGTLDQTGLDAAPR